MNASWQLELLRVRVHRERRRRQQRVKTEDRKLAVDFFDYLPLVAPPTWSFDVPHLRLIAEHLQAVKSGEIDRLAIFMPPRHSKSETCTVRFPVYLLEDEPTTRCLITGYNQAFARKLSRKVRNLVKTRMSLADDKASADEWETPQGGGLLARGVGTPPTGFGFDYIFVDDPIKKREEAESADYRDKMWDWYTDDLYTRLEPGGKIIMVLTRWHHDDLAGRAIASEPNKWTILKLPALAEQGDPLGRMPGEALWPARYDVEALGRIKEVQTKKDGAYSWEALYQQNPTPRQGSFFKVLQLQIVKSLPAKLRAVRGWDLAATPDDGDWTAGVRIAGPCENGIYYVTNVKRAQLESDDRDKLMKQTAHTDGYNTKIRLAQDPGQAGKDQAKRLVKMLAGFSVRSETVSGSKETRADGFASQVNAGNVRLLEGEWNADYIEELRTFPKGKNDDQVDGSADAFNELTLKPSGSSSFN